ncbi:MAG TPA: dienelactone hydrolase, partial [Xanthomonadaceae bacterium]|nr:dienelactone hydrolase [Xanthomonadaceae bacterium]
FRSLAGVVSLHGGLSTPTPAAAGAARTPALVLNGAADKSVDAQAIAAFEKEMDAAGADWQFVNFSGAVHCFAEADAGSDPASNCRYDARAAKRAYRMLGDFFEERFGD